MGRHATLRMLCFKASQFESEVAHHSQDANMWYEHHSYKVEIEGSTPSLTTNFNINIMSIKPLILAAKALLGKLEQVDENGVSYYLLEEAKYLKHLINEYEKRDSQIHKAVPKSKYD